MGEEQWVAHIGERKETRLVGAEYVHTNTCTHRGTKTWSASRTWHIELEEMVKRALSALGIPVMIPWLVNKTVPITQGLIRSSENPCPFSCVSSLI
jgi:hypothetical protein